MTELDDKFISNITITKNYTKCGEIFKDDGTHQLLYVCTLCTETFTDATSLVQHVYEHFDETGEDDHHDMNDHELKVEYAYSDEDILEYDIEELDEDTNPGVEHFDIVFDTDGNEESPQIIDNHEQNVSHNTSIATPKCTCCSPAERFPCFGLWQLHHQGLTEGDHPCPNDDICSAKFHTSAEAEAHSTLHFDADTYCCQHCGKTYDSEIELNLHYGQRVSSVSSFIEQKFKTASAPAIDDPIAPNKCNPVKVDHDKERAYVCNVCSKVFAHYSEIKQHMKQFHAIQAAPQVRKNNKKSKSTIRSPQKKKKPKQQREKSMRMTLKCPHCSYHASDHNQLQLHIRDHNLIPKNNVSQFKCSYCDKSFRTRENTAQHERAHTGERPFECELCGKRFNHSSYINIHMRTHTGEKPYQCEECDSAFISQSKLTSHVRKIHQKLRPHACTVCDKKFSSPSNLREHFRSEHTLDRPYECGECGKTFAKSKLLRQHEQLHRDDRRYKCRFCTMNFAQAAGKHGHERRTHAEELAASKQ